MAICCHLVTYNWHIRWIHLSHSGHGQQESYHNNNDSDIHSCILDCSKAFDHFRHDKLVQKLLSTVLPPVITRFLMNRYYINSLCLDDVIA